MRFSFAIAFPLLALLWRCSSAGNSSPALPVAERVASAFDGDRAFGYLEAQCAFGPRDPGSAGHTACRDYLASELRLRTAHVQLQDFSFPDPYQDRTLTLTNVLATFPGKNPDGKGAILLCAHWDTRPRAEMDRDPAKRSLPIVGANDGASGVAVLLEIARQLQERPPRQDVLIALWDGEDFGREGDLDHYFLGARHWAAHPTRTDIAWGILLDMVGDRNLELHQEVISNSYAPDIVRRVWRRAAEFGFSAFIHTPKHAVQDDHVPLLEKGFRVIDIIDFDYPYWHTTADTPDKCAPASLHAVGATVLSLLYD